MLNGGEGRTNTTLEDWYPQHSMDQLASTACVSMDMCPASINATPGNALVVREKIAYDRIHLATSLVEAVGKGRDQQKNAFVKGRVEDLRGTKYDSLTNRANMFRHHHVRFKQLCASTLKKARAWAINEPAMKLWPYFSRTWAF